MKKLVVAVCMGVSLVSITGCQIMESAKTDIVNKYNESVLKSAIEAKCKEYEARGDFEIERDYLLELLNGDAKKEGWNDDVAQMVKRLLSEAESRLLRKSYERRIAGFEEKKDLIGLVSWLDEQLATSAKPRGWTDEIAIFLRAKADAMRTKALAQRIENVCLVYVDKKDAVGLQKYLVGLMQKKPKGWDASIDSLCAQWLAKVTALIVDSENVRVMAAVRKALDAKDFITARKLTAVAEPFGEDEIVRNATLAFRICLLNTLVNPYQSECILEEMEGKLSALISSGDKAGARKFVEDYPLVKDEFPSIHQKVAEFRPGLEHLYYIRKTADGFLSRFDAQIQGIMDSRTGSVYKDYEEILNLSKAISNEMKRYHPEAKKAEGFGSAMYDAAQRSMTTAELNERISKGKEALLKNL